MKKPVLILLLMLLLFLSSCSSTGPLWVTDTAAAYPDSEWLYFVAIAGDRQSAEDAALTGLARSFNANVQQTTYDNQRFAQIIANPDRKRRIEASSSSEETVRESVISTNVSGLIGVQMDSWTASNGKVYANARMNRQECAARYAAMIRENERLIEQLQEEAQRYPATFDAVEILNFAFNVAQVTDNFHRVLTRLDSSATERPLRYGNADMVKAFAQNAARSIAITVKVEGDVGGRIASALGGYFTRLGYSTNSDGASAYTLSAVFNIEDYNAGHPTRQFVQYLLTYSLTNTAGFNKDFDSDSDRESGLTREQARARAIDAAVTSIGSTGFAAKFGAYLASLL